MDILNQEKLPTAIFYDCEHGVDSNPENLAQQYSVAKLTQTRNLGKYYLKAYLDGLNHDNEEDWYIKRLKSSILRIEEALEIKAKQASLRN